jgi:hypothetical protein
MSHWAKVILGMFLLPVCLGASQAMFWVLIESGSKSNEGPATPHVEHGLLPGPPPSEPGMETSGQVAVLTPPKNPSVNAASMTLVPLLAGAACWVMLYAMLPRPMWVYVFGHELTHVIWAWVFEARIKKFHVSSRGGHVILDKVNFLIVLAPYFFPLYALCVAMVYAIGNWLSDWEPYRLAFLLLLGAAYAFHVTLTFHALKTEQTDITSQGWFFSVVVIWLGNLVILVPGLCLLLGVSVDGAFQEWARATWRVVQIVTGTG